MLIEIPLDGPFPGHIDFVNDWDFVVNDWDVVVRQQVKYKLKPSKCNNCKMLGHDEKEYKKRNKGRQEWRRVPTEDDPMETNIEHLQENQRIDKGFTTSRRTIQRTTSRLHKASQSVMQNSFQALMKDEVCERELRGGYKANPQWII